MADTDQDIQQESTQTEEALNGAEDSAIAPETDAPPTPKSGGAAAISLSDAIITSLPRICPQADGRGARPILRRFKLISLVKFNLSR